MMPQQIRQPHSKPVVVVLAAGKPFREELPSSVVATPERRHVIGCVLESFRQIDADCQMVVGYGFEHITRHHPDLSYVYNFDWEHTGPLGSLLQVPIDPSRTHYICYGDILFSSTVVQQVAQQSGDVVLAIDRTWKHRYERRHHKDIERAEKIMEVEGRPVRVGKQLRPDEAHGEFVGLVWLEPPALRTLLKLHQQQGEALRQKNLPYLLEALIGAGHAAASVDVQGHWAELNAPQDIAHYFLSTKAQTLDRLRTHVQHCIINPQVAFTVADWNLVRQAVLERIAAVLGTGSLIVRSSALGEDDWDTANAGVYDSVLNVPGADPQALAQAIGQVIGTYGDANPAHQVLVQPMVQEVAAAGVVFTRTLSHGAPYFVINYDESSATDTVTSGLGKDLKMVVLHRDVKAMPAGAPPWCATLLAALAEIEGLVGHNSLDIEFAISAAGEVHIFQMRPIAVDHHQWRVSGSSIRRQIELACETFRDKQQHHARVVGRRALFGVMPDWNPAEIIGTKPAALAVSLYQYLVTDEVWATQRAEFGYRDLRPAPLVVQFANHPYVDVRASFNSFIPADLEEGLATRLVEHYLDRLEAQPELHDKVEFEIALTCRAFDFDQRGAALRQAGFSGQDVAALKAGLTQITRNAVGRYASDLQQVRELEQRLAQTPLDALPPLHRAFVLLEDCRRYGTLPFAHLARGAFVSVTLLHSAVSEGLIAQATLDAFMRSISTVSKQFLRDAGSVRRGELPRADFIATYGHLRPGTYDIESPSYRDDPETLLNPVFESALAAESDPEAPFAWAPDEWERLRGALQQLGIEISLDAFDAFLRGTIEGREWSKFIFTRNLSQGLDALKAFGLALGLDEKPMAHISIRDFWALRAGNKPGDTAAWLTERAKENQDRYQVAQSIELPPLITQEADFWGFVVPQMRPNFVSTSAVIAPVAVVGNTADPNEPLAGKIAVIPRSDPGFDWLFGHGIAGLVSAYGGANSHMAIRAAEFNLPAVIGVGEQLYDRIKNARTLEINCQQRQLRIVE